VSVRFLLPSYLRPFAGGASRLEFEGRPATVGAALDILGTLHPGVRDRVLSEDGSVRPHVNVFVGDESIRYSGGLATPLAEGAEISIVPAVSGGAPARFALALALARVVARVVAALAFLTCAVGALAAGSTDQPYPRLGLCDRAFGTGWPLVKTDGTLDATVLNQIRLRHLGLPPYGYVQPDFERGDVRFLIRTSSLVGVSPEPGARALEWDGRDEHGQAAPPGLYFLRAVQGGAVATRKLVRA